MCVWRWLLLLGFWDCDCLLELPCDHQSPLLCCAVPLFANARPPRRPGKRLLGKLILWRCAFVSCLLVILVLGVYGECIFKL